jgi:glycosyltransferase involved in cell wall biosynthesis
VYGRLALYKKKEEFKMDSEGVSVVICARNEYLNLEQFLPIILEQDYPNFEVVVVNDRSEDNSIFLLNQMAQKYPHLSVIDYKEELNFFKGKKFPLSVGIKSAKNDIVLLTDADCYPASNQWIAEFASKFDEQTEIVLGYGAYKNEKGLLNKLIRFDTVRIGALYLSCALWKKAYMGIGRNLAYRKSLFYKHNGFSSHYQIASGDDDLFINKASTRKNTRIAVFEKANTVSIPKENFIQWWNQKRRHLSTAKHYSFFSKLFLLFWEFIQYLFVIAFIASVLFYSPWYFSVGVFSFILILKLVLQYLIMNKLDEKKLIIGSIFYEFILLIIYPFLSISGFFMKPSKWK